MYPYIRAPLFVMENQYDTNQLHAQLLLPNEQVYSPRELGYIRYFGEAARG